jgi:hypothetical protein
MMVLHVHIAIGVNNTMDDTKEMEFEGVPINATLEAVKPVLTANGWDLTGPGDVHWMLDDLSDDDREIINKYPVDYHPEDNY